jgi:hypothetical protein
VRVLKGVVIHVGSNELSVAEISDIVGAPRTRRPNAVRAAAGRMGALSHR